MLKIIEQTNIGKAKYAISYHLTNKKHEDGSDFYDIKIFKNKKQKDLFIKQLSKNN